MEALISEFQAFCEAEVILQNDETRHLTAAADETFFGDLMMLVMMDLTSGYLFLEDIADDRKFDTWWKAVKPRLADLNIEVDHLITDRARALIKLATEGLQCESGADLFHGQQTLSRGLGKPLKSRCHQFSTKLKAAWENISKLLKGVPENPEIDKKADEIVELACEHNILKRDKKCYNQTMKSISTDVHAFDINSHQQQCSEDVEARLQAHADTLETIEKRHFPLKKTVSKFRKQIKALTSCIDVWWYYVLKNLSTHKLTSSEKDWLLTAVLPTVYWHKQMTKTKDPWRKKRYQDAWQCTLNRLKHHSLTLLMDTPTQEKWQDWALCMVENFHRSSSAVEGRNGTLSQMYHTRRGLTASRLNALTVIFNYDHYRADGKTPAEKLFDRSFPDLFEWVEERMDELPLPRQGKKRKLSNPLDLQGVRA